MNLAMSEELAVLDYSDRRPGHVTPLKLPADEIVQECAHLCGIHRNARNCRALRLRRPGDQGRQ